MHRQHRAMIWPPLLDPDHRAGSKPVVRMHHIEVAVPILLLKEVPNERAAHVLDLIDEIYVGVERAIMMPDPVNLVDSSSSSVAGTSKDMHFFSLALQSRGQLGYVRSDAAHRD